MMKKTIFTLLATAFLIVAGLAPAMGDNGFETLSPGPFQSGIPVHAGDYYVKFVYNGSGNVEVTLTGPSVPSMYNDPRYVTFGSSTDYGNFLRVYIDHVDNGTIYGDILKPAGGSSSPSSGTRVTCDVPGQTALGGDTVSFPLAIQNNDPSDHVYTLSSYGDNGWKTWFSYGNKGIYKISVPARQSRTVDLMVQTSGSTPVGEKKVVAYVDNIRTELFVVITSANQSADVSFKIGSKIASIGDKITYDLHIKNIQAKENIYRLSTTGLPENWYARFKENPGSSEEMAEVVIAASSDKDLFLEVVPPYSVSIGDYNFTATVTTPEGVVIKKDLALALKSGTAMTMTSSLLAYETKPGEAFSIVVYVSNTGQGAALTSVYLETTAPEGWLIQSSPNRTNSIKAGETQAFTLTIQPPGNIVASDYEVNVKAKSDQAEKEKDYRVTVKTESYVPFIGAGIIVLVAAGLLVMFKKYGRR